MDLKGYKSEAIRVTVIGAIIDLALGASKVIVGLLFYSQALVMDGIHSLSDLVTDAFVIIIAKFSFENPDDEHPYGHGKFETLGTVVIGILLIVVAVLLAIDNIQRFTSGRVSEIPEWPTLIVAAVSIISKEWIYRYTLKVGNKVKSQLLIANAWHSRSDAFSSILVFVALVFSTNGFYQVDIIMAVVLSIFIGKIGWDFIWRSLKELVDTSLEEKVRLEIIQVIKEIDGVKGLHNFRSRKVGDKALLDVNIEVSPSISVSEGHEIATWVAHKIISHFDYVYDVTVHTDVEDDRVDGQDYVSYEKKLLPLRKEILEIIFKLIGEKNYNNIVDIKIHYISDKINLDLFYQDCGDISVEEIVSTLKTNNLFRKIRFFKELN